MFVLVAEVVARDDGAAASDSMAAETVAPANARVFNSSRLCITLSFDVEENHAGAAAARRLPVR
jgi:hypothetical protein